MDDTAKLLTEIRDLLQRQLELSGLERERRKQVDEEHKAMNEQAMATQRAGMRFYRRVVLLSAPVLILLLLCLGLLVWPWLSPR